MPIVFKGWVPNVSGALSFSTMGSGSYPSQPIRANLGDQNVRYVIAYQQRNLLDAIIPIWARICGIGGKFVCLCIASCSDNPLEPNDIMKGRLFIFHDVNLWNKEVKSLIHDAQQKLRAFVNHQSTVTNLNDYFNPTATQLLGYLPSISSFFVDFTLTRSGIATMLIPDNYEQLISPDAPEFEVDGQEHSHMERIVSSQLFFFLKDLAHNHQHHDPKLDTLVDIHPVEDEDDTEWRSKILRYLYRKIIEYKRNIKPSNYHSSLGMLIYAKSFRGITYRELSVEALRPIIQDDLLEDAIKAGLQNTCFIDGDSKNETRIGFYISLVTFILTVAMLLSLTDYKVQDPDFILKALGDLLVKYTAPLLASAYVFHLVYKNITGAIDLTKSRASRTSLLILQPLDQIYAALIPILIGLIAVSSCLYFLNCWYNFPLVELIISFFNNQKLLVTQELCKIW